MTRKNQGSYIMVEYTTITRLNELGIDNGKEIMLYALIKSLCGKTNQCTPTNAFLAGVMCCTERNVQKHLHDLKERGLITTYDSKVGDYSHRTIYLSNTQKG